MSQSSPKIIVSMTTSPSRLPLIVRTLLSIIQQYPKPHKIYVNIPDIFTKTGESYPDPYEIFKDYKDIFKDIVVWNYCGEDLGPITKLQGVLDQIPIDEDTWIITIDDDIMYLNGLIDLYFRTMVTFKNKKCAYGLSGVVYNSNKLINIYSNDNVHILEGYGSVCYHRSFFPKTWDKYFAKCLENNDVKIRDDIIISNWLSLNKIGRQVVTVPWNNRKLMWANKCILDYDNRTDSLHIGNKIESLNTNVERYKLAIKYMKENELLCDELKQTTII
jgi:hypothetical protein